MFDFISELEDGFVQLLAIEELNYPADKNNVLALPELF